MKLKDHLPLKAVADDLGVSRWTLWRAARSDIADFPAPVVLRRRVYWKKSQLEALEAALLQFQGRCTFDRKRRHQKLAKKVALAKRNAGPKQKQSRPETLPGQRDLFS
jgi:predicted DNA-binding transcriptional regulator AlpA